MSLKMRFAALLLLPSAASLLCSCGSQIIPAPSHTGKPVPAGMVALDRKAGGKQRTAMNEHVRGKFGYSKIQIGAPRIRGGILLAINGRFGPEKHFDRRGSYINRRDHSLEVIHAPGRLEILMKPDNHESPGSPDDRFSFTAKPGHRYFIGYAVEDGGKIRWVPVVYDKTDEVVVPLPGVSPREGNQPPVPLYIPMYLPVS